MTKTFFPMGTEQIGHRVVCHSSHGLSGFQIISLISLARLFLYFRGSLVVHYCTYYQKCLCLNIYVYQQKCSCVATEKIIYCGKSEMVFPSRRSHFARASSASLSFGCLVLIMVADFAVYHRPFDVFRQFELGRTLGVLKGATNIGKELHVHNANVEGATARALRS